MQRGRKHRNSEGVYWRVDKLKSSSHATCGLLRGSGHVPPENLEILGALKCILRYSRTPKLYSQLLKLV